MSVRLIFALRNCLFEKHGGVDNRNKFKLDGYYAIWVDKNWRLTFRFDGEDAELVDYQDYH